jgi:hypothetical protein
MWEPVDPEMDLKLLKGLLSLIRVAVHSMDLQKEVDKARRT